MSQRASPSPGRLILILWVASLTMGLGLVLVSPAMTGTNGTIALLAWSALTAPVLVLTRARLRWETPRPVRRALQVVQFVWVAALVVSALMPAIRTVSGSTWRLVLLVPLLVSVALLVIVARRLRGGSAPAADHPPAPAATDDCPAPPASESPEDLKFTRQPMVRWFDPAQLASTGIKAVLGTVFGAYADKREIQAGAAKAREYDYSDDNAAHGGDELWIDYVADLGDGWNSTFSIASLLARPELPVTVERREVSTRRGQMLILGGDEVYPTATREQYQNRFVGPYQAALPCVTDREPPHLFAVPGNHDWYDGLTSFQRLFCQDRWIGGWKTRQTRSYFGLKLPHGWWLWGVDFQLTADIDFPQLEYFKAVATQLAAGDRIILCTPEPSWVYCGTKGPGAYQNLEYFERTVIGPSRGRVALNLSGDLHHYCRYHGGEKEKITSGGGGAFLHSTHRTPPTLTLPDGEGQVVFQRVATYPSIGKSWCLKFAVFRFPFRNPWFAVLLGAFYLLYAWILQSASKKDLVSLLERIAHLRPGLQEFPAVLLAFYRALAHSPGSVAMGGVLVAGLVAFAELDTRVPKFWGLVKRWVAGLTHGFVHLGLFVSLTWLFAWWNIDRLNLGADSPAQTGLFTAEMLVLGSILGVTATAIYLLMANLLFGLHNNEVFSSQGIADYKNFLRLHIRADGSLMLYPIKVERVCRAWRLEPRPRIGGSWFIPLDPLVGELIEQPIRFEAPRTTVAHG